VRRSPRRLPVEQCWCHPSELVRAFSQGVRHSLRRRAVRFLSNRMLRTRAQEATQVGSPASCRPERANAHQMNLLEGWGASIRRSLAVVSLVLVGACSGKGGPKYPDLNSFCNGRASAECSPEVLLACAAPNSATCIAKRQALCVSTAPAGTSYNPSSAESCITQVSNAYADAKVTLAESNAIDAACLPVFDGPSGQGVSCQKDADCKVSTGIRCVLSSGSNRGTCQTPIAVQGGGSCAASNAQCVPGFHCGPIAHCDIDAMANEACDGQNPCGPDLLCSAAGTCVPKMADGSVCATGDECLHGICNKSTMAAMGVCVSQVTLASNEPFCIDSR
jgi:hypothetical protein